MQSIKSKLPAMPSIAGSKPSTPATEEVPVVTPETIADTEQTPAPAPAPAATDSLHLPGELALASSSDIALPAAETVSTPAPAVVEPATVAAPEPVVEAPKPIEETVLPAVAPAVTPVVTEPEATPLPEVETVVVGSITGGEPGLSEPLPGLATNAEAITGQSRNPLHLFFLPHERIISSHYSLLQILIWLIYNAHSSRRATVCTRSRTYN